MYNPPEFTQDDLSILHDAIETAGLGILVTMGPGGLEASHVPMLLDRADGARGTLSGHLARANPQGRGFDPKVPALAIFQGPDAYVSPSWYPTKAATGKVVPTWNYVAIHAYGGLETFADAARLRRLVERLTDRHEAGRPAPWAVSDAPEDYIDAMLKGIVGFRLPIDRLEGKWKLSQNKNAADRAGVAAGLAAEGGADQTALVALMKQPR